MVLSKNSFDNNIHSILNSPDYKHLKNPARDFIQGLKDKISAWFFGWLKKALSNVDSAASISDKLSTIFMIIGVLVIIMIIVIIILKIKKSFERKRKLKEILGEKIDDKTTPGSLRQRALSFLEKEDYRQAIRYDFIALLLLMHDKAILYLDEAKTNEEIYLYLKKNKFSVLEVFKFLIDNFNSSWYGHKVYDKGAYDKWKNNLDLVWNEVIKHEA